MKNCRLLYLRCTVNGQQWIGNCGCHRWNVDNNTLSLRQHTGQHDLTHVRHRHNITINHIIQECILVWYGMEIFWATVAHTHIVHQNANIQMSNLRFDNIENLCAFGEINSDNFCLYFVFGNNFFGNCFQLVFGTANKDDIETDFSQLQSNE